MCRSAEQWEASKLAEAVGVPVDVLRRKITFWLANSVLAEVRRDTYRVVGTSG